MNKQTVSERYNEQQKMQGKIDILVEKKTMKGQQVSLEKLFQHITHGLGQAEQSIQQAGNEQPSTNLSNAEARITYVTGFVEQLKEELKVGNKMLQGSTKQQIAQLSDHIKQAAEIVQLIQIQLQQIKEA